MFYLGKGGGKERGSKITSRPTHNPLFFTKGYAREKKKRRRGKKQETKKIINQFARKSDPAINPFSPGCCGYVGSSLLIRC